MAEENIPTTACGDENNIPLPCEEAVAPPTKGKKRKYALSFLFLVALIGVTFYIIFKDNSLKDIFSLLDHVNLYYIGVGVICMLGYSLLHAIIIGMSANCIGSKMRLREMLQYSLVGFFYSAITPSSTGGQPMQFYYMCRDKLSPSKSTLVMFIANITYQLAIVVFGFFMLIYKWVFVSGISGGVIVFFILGISFNLFILFVLAGVLFSETLMTKLLRSVILLLSKIHIIKNTEKMLGSVEKYISEFKNGVELIRANFLKSLLIFLLTLLQQLLYHLVPYLVYRSFGFNEFSCIDFVAISSILYVSVSFLPLPGAVGASESGFVLLFRQLFGASIMPAMLLSRFINFYIMLILSGVTSFYVQLRRPYDIRKNK
ncbi:MAG: lysylphosphatidylglycerol synthase transmembrane domain-containing protein [Oscillospiraceae bacterium]